MHARALLLRLCLGLAGSAPGFVPAAHDARIADSSIVVLPGRVQLAAAAVAGLIAFFDARPRGHAA